MKGGMDRISHARAQHREQALAMPLSCWDRKVKRRSGTLNSFIDHVFSAQGKSSD
jgi:hypothetical protein